jgi:hypothetical protein
MVKSDHTIMTAKLWRRLKKEDRFISMVVWMNRNKKYT